MEPGNISPEPWCFGAFLLLSTFVSAQGTGCTVLRTRLSVDLAQRFDYTVIEYGFLCLEGAAEVPFGARPVGKSA